MTDQRLILSDVDGVMLWWVKAFDAWMEAQGYEKISQTDYSTDLTYGVGEQEGRDLAQRFNESRAFRNLEPMPDSFHYMNRLNKEFGFRFHCITSVPDSVQGVRLRNLKRIFGDLIYKVDCVGRSAMKGPILEQYKDTGLFWLEDKYTNAKMGDDLGLNALLFDQHYNVTMPQDVQRVSGWKEVYQIVRDSVLEGVPED
ncbi:MAG: hypothetical protein WCY93_11290 [Anaerolineaceae bacterium]